MTSWLDHMAALASAQVTRGKDQDTPSNKTTTDEFADSVHNWEFQYKQTDRGLVREIEAFVS